MLDASSKGIVSFLIGLINFIMTLKTSPESPLFSCFLLVIIIFMNVAAHQFLSSSPTSAVNLMNCIWDDYTINNYLWTGNIYLAAFKKDCCFTDATLSFVRTDIFVFNVQNLHQIVNSLINPGGVCHLDLLDIAINEKENYVQSQWNMVGELDLLPWKPRY